MIKFPCHCSFTFNLTDDQAGGIIQCPRCGRLNDIPTLSDLPHIRQDGTYDITEPIKETEQDRLGNLRRAFATGTTDEQGNELDLRPSIHDIRNAGASEIPLSLHDEILPGAPKYDPVTGELVRPMDVKTDADPATSESADAVPMATRNVSYAPADLEQPLSIARVPLALFRPMNLFVMFFVIVGHGLLLATLLITLFGLLFVAPIFIALLGILMGHYAIVVDEIGTESSNDLPRPLRQLAWLEDLWNPFVHILGAIVICFLPALLALRSPSMDTTVAYPLAACLAFIGAFFFPAVFLTTCTSGSVHNLRPDRLVGVITTCGAAYLGTVILLLIAGSVYLLGIVGTGFHTIRQHLPGSPDGPKIFEPIFSIPALIGGIYLMHWFCVILGLLYRRHHDAFPWVFQRHIPRRLKERVLGIGVPAPGEQPPRGPRPTREQRRQDALERLKSDPRNQRRQPES